MIDAGLRTLFHHHLRSYHWIAVETALTGAGVPDSNYCCSGIEGWVEYKATKGWGVSMRVEQVGWILRRCRAGGRVFIAVRQTGIRDDLWLIKGAFVVEARDNGLKELPPGALVYRGAGGPKGWDWNSVSRGLLT